MKLSDGSINFPFVVGQNGIQLKKQDRGSITLRVQRLESGADLDGVSRFLELRS